MQVVPLYLTFALTGVGVALPGALLPALLTRWHLGDEQGGRLFLMAWLGSSLGALLVRGSLKWSLMGGGVAVAAGCILLGLCNGFAADLWMLMYGTGLGLTMTATSLMRQQQASDVGPEMVRLNLIWAVGACAGPSLTMRALATGRILPLLLALATCFTAFAFWMIFQPNLRLFTSRDGKENWLRLFRSAPMSLILITMLITGTEASAGAWLATYAARSGGLHAAANTIVAPSCLWAGLLASRLLWSVKWRIGQAHTVMGSLVLMAAASLLLVSTRSPWTVLAAAFALGFGIGPVYPLLLAWALNYYRGGAIFFMAGVGSSVLPWLTGFVSAHNSSLRIGMLVPMAGTLAMLGLAVTAPLREWSSKRV